MQRAQSCYTGELLQSFLCFHQKVSDWVNGSKKCTMWVALEVPFLHNENDIYFLWHSAFLLMLEWFSSMGGLSICVHTLHQLPGEFGLLFWSLKGDKRQQVTSSISCQAVYGKGQPDSWSCEIYPEKLSCKYLPSRNRTQMDYQLIIKVPFS